jgi:hypothetical protein
MTLFVTELRQQYVIPPETRSAIRKAELSSAQTLDCYAIVKRWKVNRNRRQVLENCLVDNDLREIPTRSHSSGGRQILLIRGKRIIVPQCPGQKQFTLSIWSTASSISAKLSLADEDIDRHKTIRVVSTRWRSKIHQLPRSCGIVIHHALMGCFRFIQARQAGGRGQNILPLFFN